MPSRLGHYVMEQAEPPSGIAASEVGVEGEVGRGCIHLCFAKRTVEEQDAADGRSRPAPAIKPSVAAQGEMWIMLMAMIASARANRQLAGFLASSRTGARTFGSLA